MMAQTTSTLLLIIALSYSATAFVSPTQHIAHKIPGRNCYPSTKTRVHPKLDSSKNDEDQEAASTERNLKGPPINIRKESILFGENPATAENNNISRVWIALKDNLPYIFTGVPKGEASPVDDNPIGAIYNMVFVRFPSVLAALVYSKNLTQGHPLYCDVGAGPFEIPPLIVYSVLIIILR